MPKPPIKYNPAFLTDDELAAAFVVRQDDLDSIVRVIRENTCESNQHVLVVGPRGIGKTMLVRRVSLAVRRDAALQQAWHPLVFAEESYEVGTAGEFWLESLFHLANQTGDAQWLRTYEELRQEPVEDRLCERALAQLLDFADLQGKRILLVVENLNMILSDQLKEADAWRLRKTLMHEPRLMLLATATARLDGPQNLQKAMYELFKTQELHPLDDADCQAIWRSIAGHDLGPRRIRAISILTGGSPRLLAIISHFGARMSFSELMQDMTGLVDDHTDYFKSHLDALPATERKVYVALTDLWDPSTARDVAVASRQSVSQASAMLRRLVTRGAVIEAPGKGRTKRYQVAERMYNIYYLMRRRGAPSERVKVAVQFMVQFYEETEIVEVTRRLSEEACGLAREDRQHHFHAFERILRTAQPDTVSRILQGTPRSFLDAPDQPESLRQRLAEIGFTTSCPCGSHRHPDERVRNLMEQGIGAVRAKRWEDAEHAYREVIEADPNCFWAWVGLGDLLCDEHLGRYSDAEEAYRKAVEVEPDNAWGWHFLGQFLGQQLGRYPEAEDACRRALDIEPGRSWAWGLLGHLLDRGMARHCEAVEAYRRAIELNPKDALTWERLVQLMLADPGNEEQALLLAERALVAVPGDAWLFNSLAWTFYRSGPGHCLPLVEGWSRMAVELDGRKAYVYTLACVLARAGKSEEAMALTGKLLEGPEYVGGIVGGMVTLFAELVAAGSAAEAFPVLRDSKSAAVLEPILVAIEMELAMEVHVAPEIAEVAKDVRRRFEEVRARRTEERKG